MLNVQNKIDIIRKAVQGYRHKYDYIEIDQNAVDCVYDFYNIIINSTAETVIRNILNYTRPMPTRSHLSIVYLYIGFFCEIGFASVLGVKISNCYYKLSAESGNVHAMTNLGFRYFKMDNFDKALAYFKLGLDNNHPNINLVYRMISRIYYETGEYANSLANCYRLLGILLEQFQSGKPNSWSLGTVYNDVELVYFKLGIDHEEAGFFEMFQGNEINVFGIVHFNSAWFNQKSGNDDQAITSYELALKDNFANPVEIYDQLAPLFYKKKDYVHALKYYKMLFKNGQHHLVSTICLIHSKKKDNVKSLKYFKKCVELSSFSDDVDISETTWEILFKNNLNYDSLIHFYIYEKNSKKILDLLDTISMEELLNGTIEEVGNYFSSSDNNNCLHKFIRNIIKSKIDLLEIHFKYAVDSDGYNNAKTEFYNNIAGK